MTQVDAPMPQRILLYGVTGSGKSTLARAVAARTGLPFVDVDSLTWQPGWVEVPKDEQRRRFEQICRQDRWILDTAYSGWRDVVLARVELIVALDYPRRVSLTRLVRRTAVRVLTRRPVCNGNVETLRNTVSADSILRWHARSFASKRTLVRQWDADPALPVVRLTSPRATRRWLASFG